ncbi:hypothetical protein UFOVP1383_43 [uncultured Caudovirales phage]|uniref:Uncharacterized protein n=1 Tax=uncultured Caudovirales phage TaxID=2100421 RepID=A0A6J5P508_9CAUD|nr:hypothetical protein UFOVP848_57 [uncultured Caudovirales phage]CAB4172992.1 hypothetical protein UFOVP945_8 [uncultured Caudovirales phage]CAB4179651.1 hypothetical protein UFOVP1023_34 [uncultured Caudovirales phage]CAB4204242.1 hypothetical protein UFOVP1383_43 [uncultured Caudovirales phage]CAB4215813.1 hypothetical protein UFOVP1477_5 [uncultured Caudovirales phage]
MKLPIFLHQFDTGYGGSLLPGDDAALPFSELWVKTNDGLAWMSNFDRHPARVGDLGQVQRLAAMYAGQGITMRPWFVPHGREVTGSIAELEGRLAGQIAAVSGGVALVDLEPHEPAPGGGAYYWRDDLGASGEDVGLMISTFLANGGRELWLVPDARPGRMPSFMSWWASPTVTRVLPQVYWTDFQQPYRVALDRAIATLTSSGVQRVSNVFPVLPGNATPDDLVAGIRYAKELGCGGVSIWQRSNLPPESAAALAALEDPWAAPPPPPPSTSPAWREHVTNARNELNAALAAS